MNSKGKIIAKDSLLWGQTGVSLKKAKDGLKKFNHLKIRKMKENKIIKRNTK